MPTPPMLRSREPAAVARSGPRSAGGPQRRGHERRRPPGLLLAGILAVYDWKTPGAEAPLVFWTAVVAIALFAVDVLVVGLRYVRRLRLGL